jgi:hypothetical protein
MLDRNAADNGFVIKHAAAFTSGSYKVFYLGGTYYTA